MAATVQGVDTVYFRGAPATLSAIVRARLDVAGRLPVTLEVPMVPSGLEPITVHAAPMRGSDLTRLRLRLPKTTPPGTYRGVVQIEGENQPVVVEVQPRRALTVFPRQTYLEAPSGHRVALRLSVANLGNVRCEVQKVSIFGLFPVRGMDEVVAKTLDAELREGELRVDRFINEIREAHGGSVRFQVRDGAGSLEPGETRELELELRLPGTLRAGRMYRGVLPLDVAKHRVELQVTAADSGGRER